MKQEQLVCKTCGDELIQGKKAPMFPFCSKRCKMVDLNRWFRGEYHISEKLASTETEIWSESLSDEE